MTEDIPVSREWWETFFDEDYTQAWSAAESLADTSELIDQIVTLLDLPPGAAVLDVGCGFGRIAGPLHHRGYGVTGIDIAPAQLQLAKEQHPGPVYVEADMRRPHGVFDAVLNLYSTFGYFADPREDRAALDAWARSLRPGGVLLMDLTHRDQVAHAYGRDQARPSGVTETGHTDWVTGVSTTRLTYRDIVKIFRVRLYTVTELVSMIRASGFREVKAYGDLSGGPLTPQTRLVLRAVG